MKKWVILAVLLMLPISMSLKAQEESPYSILTMAAAGVNDGFESWSGGFLVGGRYPVAKDGDVGVQVVYSQFNWNPEAPLQIIQPVGVVEFDLGKNYRLDLFSGGQFYIDGQNTDANLLAGFGAAKKILSFSKENATPGSIDLMTQMLIVNANDNSTGNYWQLGLGLQINMPR